MEFITQSISKAKEAVRVSLYADDQCEIKNNFDTAVRAYIINQRKQ